MTKHKGPRPKHVPQRTCVACRKTESKRGLIRLVRSADGRVVIDPTGKQAGRGAYLCAERSCWEMAFKRKAMERALRIERLDPADVQTLTTYATALPSSAEEDEHHMATSTS
jgi:predicted RNA-binding protein YlxR (DUF448 family)